MRRSKGRDLFDATAELASVMLQRDMGLATEAEVAAVRERVLRAREAAREETIAEALAACEPVRDRKPTAPGGGYRGPRIGTNLGDLLAASGLTRKR